MDEKKDNRRVRYTKKVLRESLIELLKEKPISRITVTDICTHADLNRGTFYNYYCDAYDLLAQIEDSFYNNLLKQLERFKTDGISGTILAELLSTIEQNRDLCNVLFNINADKTFLNRLLDLMKEYAFAYWEEHNVNNLNESQMELLYSFFSNGAVGVLCRWIAGDLDVSRDYLAKTILALGIKGAEYFFNEQDQALPVIKLNSTED
ncbi:MAG: TetR family transcriptional regulator C-terminal domain-containing protein [Clostridia bacterium]|nr:TetR family transcriptional regulator C-terminal domain-containing protein [Clostridia bacterium]MBR3954280.1 TetR family transcriptional regulator C-terminal domain-containing protein [Clostridia bacterium]